MAAPAETQMGKNLRARRESLGWGRRTLEKHSGVSEATIARIELYGQSPTLSTLAALANALDVNVTDLLAKSEPGGTAA